jgi:hypothetical protein
MNNTCISGCVLVIVCAPLIANGADPNDRSEVTRVGAFIDQCIDEQLAAAKVTAAPLSDDAEFLRRVYLDIAGRIPTVSEVRSFLNDSSPDKRRQLVDRLLDSPRYPIHFARRWRAVWLPPANNNLAILFQQTGFENWLRVELVDDVSYSRLVSRLLALPTTGVISRFNDVVFFTDGSPSSSAFYGSRQLDRDEIAAAVARTMLGVRIECAQCHDHPFDVWRKDQFHSFAALFDGVSRLGQNLKRTSEAKPVFLDGTTPPSNSKDGHLTDVTAWMTAPENKYFSRAAVNRVWSDFFGVGIVEPVDDFSDHNPPSHPRLLEGLSSEFVAHQYDLKFLIRSVVASRAYQRTSRNIAGLSDPRLFAHGNIRSLTAEQLWDNLEQLTSISPQRAPEMLIRNPGSQLSEFKRLFSAEAASTGDHSTTILQALALMNGQIVTEATTFTRGALLSAIVEYPGLTIEEKIETLYLSTVSRRPLPHELARSTTYATEGSNTALLSDLLWALINSSEFVTNH